MPRPCCAPTQLGPPIGCSLPQLYLLSEWCQSEFAFQVITLVSIYRLAWLVGHLLFSKYCTVFMQVQTWVWEPDKFTSSIYVVVGVLVVVGWGGCYVGGKAAQHISSQDTVCMWVVSDKLTGGALWRMVSAKSISLVCFTRARWIRRDRVTHWIGVGGMGKI